MANRTALFKQTDVKRLVKGAREAGLEVGRVEVEGSRIVIFAKGETSPPAVSELQAWMRQNGEG